jgi:hypothetical protein
LLKWFLGGPLLGREPSNDYFIKILFLLSKWFQTRRFLWEFPIGSYVKLSSAVAAILVCVLTILYRRWPPLLIIEFSSNGQNCSILSQKVPKFELYKHNDELFNIYYGIFYELWTFSYFDRLCKLEKRGDEI